MKMEKKFKVSEFASLVGCSQKTVYRMIERGELITSNELSNGRKIVFIFANNKQIEEIKKNQVSNSDNDSQYEENLRENDMSKGQNKVVTSSLVDKIIELSKDFNDRLITINEELVTYKSRVPLLEDKANREGLYLQEINQLKTDNDTLTKLKNKVVVTLISVIFLSLIIACVLSILLVIEHNKPPKVIETEKVVEKVVEKPVYKYIKR